MLIPPKYFLTPKISELLGKIEAARAVIDSITIPPELETNIRRQSTLKSSLFSARIEGNTLTLEELANKSSKDQKRVEVYNILSALNSLYKTRAKDISIKDILELHKTVMQGLTPDNGSLRREVSAIFNTAGIAIYMPPPPRSVVSFLERLLKFMNSSKEQFIPVRAVLAHYMFEKIHPFLDGNGRVGRLILMEVLLKGRYGMKGLLTTEEYLDEHRSMYYRMLENTEKDVTDFVEFMLLAIAETAKKAQEIVQQKQDAEKEDYLLPRRAEIFNIIKDQTMVSFDQIRRRFIAVNERTLRYDLKKLADSGFIRKRGTTKGVYYEAII